MEENYVSLKYVELMDATIKNFVRFNDYQRKEARMIKMKRFLSILFTSIVIIGLGIGLDLFIAPGYDFPRRLFSSLCMITIVATTLAIISMVRKDILRKQFAKMMEKEKLSDHAQEFLDKTVDTNTIMDFKPFLKTNLKSKKLSWRMKSKLKEIAKCAEFINRHKMVSSAVSNLYSLFYVELFGLDPTEQYLEHEDNILRHCPFPYKKLYNDTKTQLKEIREAVLKRETNPEKLKNIWLAYECAIQLMGTNPVLRHLLITTYRKGQITIDDISMYILVDDELKDELDNKELETDPVFYVG